MKIINGILGYFFLFVVMYSCVHICSDSLFSKILKKPSIVQKHDTSYKRAGFFTEVKQKKIKMAYLENSKWPPQKNLVWFGPWLSRIDWCKGHWFVTTYMVVRLSDISSKTGKKCVFCVFRLFLSLCRTASRPYKLRQINALRINQFY